MSTMLKALGLIGLYCVGAGMAAAQPPPSTPVPVTQVPKATAQSEAGEPRADTSRAPAASTAPSPSPSPSPGQVPAAPATAPATAPAAAKAAARPSTARSAGPGRATTGDRLDLGTATVTGSQEQPKVMYIVPWKRSDIGDLAGKPMNSLVDEILAPVDRDVFKREVIYYQAVQADASQNGASAPPSQQGEK